MPDFTVEQLNPRDLTPNPLNWRRHPQTQREVLAYSLEKFGFVQGVVLNKQTGNLIDGHARVEEAIEQGRETIPVNVVDLSEEDERELLRLFDPIGALAETDTEALDRLIAEIGNPDLEAMLQGIGSGGSGLLVDADTDAIPEDVETRCKPGDLWRLGEHRLLCGDSLLPNNVRRLTDRHPQLGFADPPYNIGLEYASYDDDLSSEDYEGRVRDWFEALAQACDRFIVTPGRQNIGLWASLAPCHIGCWTKANAHGGAAIAHFAKWEPLFFYGKHLRQRDCDVFDHHVDNGFLNDQAAMGHVCPKPARLLIDLLENYSTPRETVYDPFAGSGTTLIACEQTGRVCRAMELEPKYCDVILARWEQATGNQAVLL